MIKQFKVAAVSESCNSFGLRGMLLIARDGEAWEVGANSLNVKPEGAVLKVPYLNRATWSEFGFEIPHRIEPDAPPELVEDVWGRQPTTKEVVKKSRF